MNRKNLDTRRSFLKKTIGATAAFSLTGVVQEAKSRGVSESKQDDRTFENDSMLSGYAETDITPDIGLEQPGGYGKSFHQRLHDPCKVRAAVFEDGDEKVALVGLDALVIYQPLVDNARARISKKCKIAPDSILISASHSHSSGPTGMVQPGEYDHASELVKELAYERSSCADPDYLTLVEDRIVEAVTQADDSRINAQLGVGSGSEEKAAYNRRYHMTNGLTYTHPGQLNPDIIKVAGPIDPEVGVIGTWDEEGNCIGCVVNYACHATTNPGGISANWIYFMEQTIRGAMGQDCIVVFLPGACGDITQVDNLNPDVNRRGAEWARYVGGRVGSEVVNVLLEMPRGVLVPIHSSVDVLNIKRRVPAEDKVKESYDIIKRDPGKVGHANWVFAKETIMLSAKIEKEPEHQVEVQAIQIGPAVFVTNPAEFFCQLGLDIKANSQFKYTFPVELANDCVGYIPTLEAFASNGGGYETRLTSYSNLEIDAGNRVVQAGLELIRDYLPGIEPQPQPAPTFTGEPWAYGNIGPELS